MLRRLLRKPFFLCLLHNACPATMADKEYAMPEVYPAKLHDTKERIEVIDPESLPSAIQFKALSDAIWARKLKDDSWSSFAVPSIMRTGAAIERLNSAVREIDEKLVITGISRAIDLGKVHGVGEPVVLDADTMDQPRYVTVGTFNWDERNTWRAITVDGKPTAAVFTDSHRDYHRELDLSFALGANAHATYSIARIQGRQDQPTSLGLNVWHQAFAETGYEGHQLAYVDITPEQELKVIGVMQAITGQVPL